MFCKNCGNQMNPGDVFCGNCGTPVSVENTAAPQEEPVARQNYSAPQPVYSAPQERVASSNAVTEPVGIYQPMYNAPQQPVVQQNTASSYNPVQPQPMAFTPQQPKKKKSPVKAIVLSVVSLVVVAAIIIGAFAIFGNQADKWYVAQSVSKFYYDGELDNKKVQEYMPNGQELLFEDGYREEKYTYDEDGKLIKVEFTDKDDPEFSYEYEYEYEEDKNGNQVGVAENIHKEEFSEEYRYYYELTYNKKNVLIKDYHEYSDSLGSKYERTIEYDEKGRILKKENVEEYDGEEETDIIEYSYNKDKSYTVTGYRNDEKTYYAEYDKYGRTVLTEEYLEDKDYKMVIDWGKSKTGDNKYYGGYFGVEMKEEFYIDDELMYELYVEETGENEYEVIMNVHDEDWAEETGYKTGKQTYAEFTTDDKENIIEIEYKDTRNNYTTKMTYEYDKYGHCIKQEHYYDDVLSSVTEYEWAKK